LLRLDAISKSFGERRALADVSLAIGVGEAVLLVGENGAGKTTLLRVATGYLDPDAGTVAIDGIAMARDRARAQGRLGYLSEHAPSSPELGVAEYLRARARVKGLDRRAAATAADRAIAELALAEVAAQRIATLSKGFRQRVGLADALLGDPPLLVLDEPTSGLDPIGAGDFDTLIATLQRTLGLTVFMVTHDLDSLHTVCDRIAVLADGKVIAAGTMATMLASTHPWLRAYFHGKRSRAGHLESLNV
jgi:phospholipid/cholesterol/gamma-HCH transport system ATP-binding protein